MHTIKRASEMIGVQMATLRAWERRYEIAVPRRSSDGHRLYDDEAVRAWGTMNSLVLEGWTPQQAAEETRRRLGAEAGQDRATGGDPQVAGGCEELLHAAERLDVAAVTRVVDAQFASAPPEDAIDNWLMPSLRELGLAWASGRVTVAGEHMVAHAVVRRLWSAYEDAEPERPGPKVIIGLPPKSRHELGLLGFAVAARRAGLDTTYVGADLPAEDWARAVEAREPAALVLAASMNRDLTHLSRVVEVLDGARPDLLIAVGGGLQDRTPEQCVRLGHRVGDAAAELVRQLSAAPSATRRPSG
ncbi:MerR family transcriptional regulator [Nocardioides gilvus]|uniref:MerR family transcriptional regulator n=1 Tax=Nocardioides gilvus TaxID=1735589 RepID=UPI000D749E7C|nr:cobalamin-dependent protein [Nocardioides gilvus]